MDESAVSAASGSAPDRRSDEGDDRPRPDLHIAADRGHGEAAEGEQPAAAGAGAGEPEPEPLVVGAQQIAESLSALDTLKSSTIEHVTAVRLEANANEAQRRDEEAERRQDRLWRLQEEAVASGKANAAVEMRWNDLNEYNMPQELQREIDSQREACEAILASKDQLVREFMAELKAKDEEYVKALQGQRDSVDDLVGRLDAQYAELRDAYERELAAVEEAFKAERQSLLEQQQSEMAALFKRRRDMEAQALESKLDAEKRYAEEIDQLQANDAEDYARLKMTLEGDVQALEQQLAVMRAMYMLNTEKLDYNYRVLTEREAENDALERAQREKNSRLEAALARIKGEYSAAEKRHRERNKTLTSEFSRVTRQYRDLQQKAAHFAHADSEKFREVWQMHEEEARRMVDRLVEADRVICEQVLGWRWAPPGPVPTPALGGAPEEAAGVPAEGAGAAESKEEAAPAADSAAAAAAAGSTGGATATGGGATASRRRVQQEEPWLQLVEASLSGDRPEPAQPALPSGGNGTSNEHRDALVAAVAARQESDRRSCIRMALRLLLEEAAFLAVPVRPPVGLSRPPSDELLRAVGLLRSLEIATVAQLEELVQEFVTEEDDDDSDVGSDMAGGSRDGLGDDDDEADDDGERRPHGRLRVAPEEVVTTLRKFMEDRTARRREAADGDGGSLDDAGAAAGAGGDQPGASRAASAAGPRSAAASRAGAAVGGTQLGFQPSAGRERALHFWARLAETVPPRTVRIWKALEGGLQKYTRVLKRRAGLLDELDDLRDQNLELRQLLGQYLRSDVNRELQVPPAHTVSIAGGGGAR